MPFPVTDPSFSDLHKLFVCRLYFSPSRFLKHFSKHVLLHSPPTVPIVVPPSSTSRRTLIRVLFGARLLQSGSTFLGSVPRSGFAEWWDVCFKPSLALPCYSLEPTMYPCPFLPSTGSEPCWFQYIYILCIYIWGFFAHVHTSSCEPPDADWFWKLNSGPRKSSKHS